MQAMGPHAAALADPLAFRCNLCGATSPALPLTAFRRGAPTCPCGSSVRTRSLVHALSTALFGESLDLADFPRRRDLRGIGTSDDRRLARRLRAALPGYRNTFLHRRPRFDVTRPPARALERYDFVITSDVFEHVAAPVERAFAGLFAVLAPGGFSVFSVPYHLAGPTLEHFADLVEWRLERDAHGPVVVGRDAHGDRQERRDLVFHGGPGETLELRRFGLDDLLEHFRRAGFAPPELLPEAVPERGILGRYAGSRTMIVRKPDYRRADAPA